MTHLLVIVVALIEALFLLTFTTYSWIESSSSLVISSDKGGLGKMSVANNLYYQVRVAQDSAGNVELAVDNNSGASQSADDSTKKYADTRYFRSVQNFNYAKTTSPDGQKFYFRTTGGTNTYRAGDTADYNTSYTYLDFEVNNTTGTPKSFYFRDADILSVDFDEGVQSVLGENESTDDFEDTILKAMRISFFADNDPFSLTQILSLNGSAAESVFFPDDDMSQESTEINVPSYPFSDFVYDSEDENVPALFSSDPDGADEDKFKVSVRIWFEERDSSYLNAIRTPEAKAKFDSILNYAKISVNFYLVSDDVDYDTVYFDDYAFSHKSDSLGKFVTEENSAYGMYLHVYNSKLGGFTNYRMAKDTSNSIEGIRWKTVVPIPYVVDDSTKDDQGNITQGTNKYLTSSNVADNSKLANAYFFYGTAASGTAEPTAVMYKWSLPGTLSITGNVPTGSPNDFVITDATKYFRNLGVVRSAVDQTSQIPGFIEFDRPTTGSANDDPMQLVYLRDRATGLTASGYNVSDTSSLNYQYITRSIHDVSSVGSTTVSFDTSGIDHADDIYYADVPAGAYVIFHHNNYQHQTLQTGWQAQDGVCIYPTTPASVNDKNYNYEVYDVNLPALNDSTGQMVRVYFYNALGWSTPIQVHTWGVANTGDSQGGSISNMTTNTVTSDTFRSDGVYLNDSAGETAATKTVAMYYDGTAGEFKAYVPTRWLTNGFYTHYNTLDAYYSLSQDKIRWNTGAASSYNSTDYRYTVLGYSGASTVSAVTESTTIESNEVTAASVSGVGTWSDVREMRFGTELIDTKYDSNEALVGNISSAYRYKTAITSGEYPMIPVNDGLYLTFLSYVPTDDLANQSKQAPKISFKRYTSYNNGSAAGTWIPDESITNDETVYYPVDPNGDTTLQTPQGWFHVAVLVDNTFDNLIYKTVLGSDADANASISYSYTETGTYNQISHSGNNGDIKPYRIDNQRWVVPMKSGGTIHDTVYFKWSPYPATNTEFVYAHDTAYGIYCVVTEANASAAASP